MSDLPPPLLPEDGSESTSKARWFEKRLLKAPVWAWIIAIVVVAGMANSAAEQNSGNLEESEDSATTTTIFYRYESSDDPIENLLWIANSETVSLPGWRLLGKTYTDDDIVYDDIRINVAEQVDYQSLSDSRALIDVAMAIVSRAMSPIQIDLRVEVVHSEVQPDGSIEFEEIRREWIEVTGDREDSLITVDVYGFMPEEEADMRARQAELQGAYPDAIVKLTDTSSFDD